MTNQPDETPMAGYALHVLRTMDSTAPPLRILLRRELCEALTLEWAQKLQELRELDERLAQESAKPGARGGDASDSDSLPDKTVGTRALPPERLRRRDELSPEEQAQLIESFEERDPALAAQFPVHRVLRGRDVLDAVLRARDVRDGDNSKKELELLARVIRQGAFRAVRNPGRDAGQWTGICRRLDTHHPQFRSVTQLVKACADLATEGHCALRVPPILLVGPPGIGKTHYAFDLADAMGLPIRIQSMENAQSPALFLGTERHWSTSGTGILFELVVLGEVANPVVVIDEIDKCKAGHYEPTNAFHTLLEPRTAACVRDAGLDLPFDASLVFYIATANDEHALPLSLRSRFKIFPILPPTGAEALDLAHVVATDAVAMLRVPGFAPPPRSLTKALAHLTAREIKNTTQVAVGAARAAGRKHLDLLDFPADLLDDQDIPNARRLH